MNLSVLKNTTQSVIIKVVADTGGVEYDPLDITWSDLSPLFDDPDANGSITGERQASHSELVCKSIAYSINGTKATTISWVDSGGAFELIMPVVPGPSDGGGSTESIILPGGGEIFQPTDTHSTDAVRIDGFDWSTSQANANSSAAFTITFGTRVNVA
jgi:hypothetical protein